MSKMYKRRLNYEGDWIMKKYKALIIFILGSILAWFSVFVFALWTFNKIL